MPATLELAGDDVVLFPFELPQSSGDGLRKSMTRLQQHMALASLFFHAAPRLLLVQTESLGRFEWSYDADGVLGSWQLVSPLTNVDVSSVTSSRQPDNYRQRSLFQSLQQNLPPTPASSMCHIHAVSMSAAALLNANMCMARREEPRPDLFVLLCLDGVLHDRSELREAVPDAVAQCALAACPTAWSDANTWTSRKHYGHMGACVLPLASTLNMDHIRNVVIVVNLVGESTLELLQRHQSSEGVEGPGGVCSCDICASLQLCIGESVSRLGSNHIDIMGRAMTAVDIGRKRERGRDPALQQQNPFLAQVAADLVVSILDQSWNRRGGAAARASGIETNTFEDGLATILAPHVMRAALTHRKWFEPLLLSQSTIEEVSGGSFEERVSTYVASKRWLRNHPAVLRFVIEDALSHGLGGGGTDSPLRG